jgi:serine/threonine protein phosphatase 1
MRILAIGDIHGCASALDTLLAAVAPAAGDTVVTLGDYVDRGLNSPGVLDRLLALGQDLHLVALRGNHDQMMLNARHDPQAFSEWREVGGAATLRAYGDLDAVPPAHWRFLETQCVDSWECETHFFVHAGVYADVPLWEQPKYVLYWQRFERVRPHESGKVMVCGHTSQKSGLPRNLGFAVCLDTYAYGGGWLSCLDIGSGQVWQADHNGHVRQLRLADRLEEGG